MTNFQILLNLAIEGAIRAGEKTLVYYKQELDIIVKSDNSPLTQADTEANQIIGDLLSPTGIPLLSEENEIIAFEERSKWPLFWLVDPLDGTKEFINKSDEYTVNIALIEAGKPVLGVVFVPAKGILYYGLKDFGSYRAFTEVILDIERLRNKSVRLPFVQCIPNKLVVVSSKSHASEPTLQYLDKLVKLAGEAEIKSFGSSLKLCMIAEGSAGIYPRLGPTMEWDTAASHAIAEFAGCKVLNFETRKPLIYNKESMLNPSFLVYREEYQTLIDAINERLKVPKVP